MAENPYICTQNFCRMSGVFVLFMVLLMILSVLLIIIIMAQNPKGGGLSATFGGSSSAQFGVQRTNDFMEKATWILACSIVVLVTLSVVMTATPNQTQPLPTKPKQTAPVNTQPVKPGQPAPVAPVK